MSQSIDQRIVEMKFDNAQFEKSVKQTISSLEQLEEALNFKDAQKSFQELEDAANNVDLSHLEDSVDVISDRFSNMGILGMQIMERLSNRVIDLGINLTKSLTVNQLGAGWSKYESLMEASQVMVNNIQKEGETAEETMTRVQPAINEILEYTDATSYSFDQLISTLGKFTSAGVELESAVVMVEGIANWSATAGISAQKAAPMFYNLAQAMASGALKAQDWKSLELLSAQTPDFLNKAIEMGLAYGTIEDAGNGFYKAGKHLFNASEGFRDSLETGWFSKEVLGATLLAYGNTAEEFGQKAYDAAYQAKTFTDAINAVKDAVSTGWTESFEKIFGNFTEAAEFFTRIADYLIEIFNSGKELRVTALSIWKDAGGREDFIDGLYKIFEIIIAIKDTIHEAIFNVLNPARNFAEDAEGYLSDAQFVALNILNITHGIAEAIRNVYGWVVGVFEAAEPILKSVEPVGQIVKRTVELVDSTEGLISSTFFDGRGNVIDHIDDTVRTVAGYVTGQFKTTSGELVTSVIDVVDTTEGLIERHLEDQSGRVIDYADGVASAAQTANDVARSIEKSSTVAVDEKLAQKIYDTFPREIKDIIANGYEVDYKRTSDWRNEDKWWDYQQALTGVDQTNNKLLSHAYGEFGSYQKEILEKIEKGEIKREDVDTSKWTKAHIKAWEEYWEIRDRMDTEAAAAAQESEETSSQKVMTSSGRLEKLQRIVQGLVSVFNIAKRIITGIAKGVGKLLVKLSPLIDMLLDIGAFLGDILVYLDGLGQFIENSVGSAFEALGEFVRPVIQSISDWFKNTFGDFSTPEARAERLAELITKISNAFTWLDNNVRPVINSVTTWFGDQVAAVKKWAEGTTLYKALSNFFGAEEITEINEDGEETVRVVTFLDRLWSSVSDVLTSIQEKFEEFKNTKFYQTLSDIFETKIIGKTGRQEDGDEAYIYETFFDRLVTSITTAWDKFTESDFYKFFVKSGNTISSILDDIFGVKANSVATQFTDPNGQVITYFGQNTFWDRIVEGVTSGIATVKNVFEVEIPNLISSINKSISDIWEAIAGVFVSDEDLKNANEGLVEPLTKGDILKGRISSGVSGIGTFITEFFGDMATAEGRQARFSGLISSVTETFNTIKTKWNEFTESDFYKFFVNAGNTISSIFNDIFGAKANSVATQFTDPNGQVITYFGQNTFLDRVKNFFSTINGIWEEIQKSPLYQALSSAVSSVSTFISNFIGDMSDPIKRAARFEELNEKIAPILGFFSNMFSGIAGLFSGGESKETTGSLLQFNDLSDIEANVEQAEKENLGFSERIVGGILSIFTTQALAEDAKKTGTDKNEKAISFWKWLGTSIGNLFKNISKAVGEIKEGFKGVTGLDLEKTIKSISDWIWKIFGAVLLFKGVWAILSFIQHFEERYTSFITDFAALIGSIGLTIAIYTIAMKVFAGMKPEEITQASWVMSAILGAIALTIGAIFGFSITLGKTVTDPKVIKGIAATISGIASIIKSIGLSVLLLSISIALIGNMKTEKFQQGYNAVLVLLGIILGATAGLVALSSMDFGAKFSPRKASKSIMGIALMIAAIGVAVLMVAISIKIFEGMDFWTFMDAIWKVVLIVGGLYFVARGLIKAAMNNSIDENKKVPKELASLAAILIAIGGLVAIISGSILLLTLIDEKDRLFAAGAAAALTGILWVIGELVKGIIKEMSKLNKDSSKKIAGLGFIIAAIGVFIAAIVAGLVVLTKQNVGWAEMAVYFLGIAIILGVMLGIVEWLRDANLGVGTLKSAAILTAAIGILLVGLGLIAKLITSLAKSAADDIAYIIRTVSYAIGSAKTMIGSATTEDFQPVIDIVKMFIEAASEVDTSDFWNLEQAVMDVYDVCTDIDSAYDMLPPEGFKRRFDEVIEVIDAFKLKATECTGVSFNSLGDITFYIEQMAAGLKTSGGLFLDAQKNEAALSFGIQKTNEILGISDKASKIAELSTLPTTLATLGAAVALFFGALVDPETGDTIDTSKKVDVANLADIFNQLATYMPDNSIIGQIQSYAQGGDNDMVAFGLGIVAIGQAMRQYQDEVQNIDSAKLEPAMLALSFFQQLNADLRGGNVQKATNEANALNTTLSTFGNDIQILGESLTGYYEKVENFEKAKFEPAEEALNFFRILRNKLTGFNDNGEYTFQTFITSFLPSEDKLKTFGREIKQVGGAVKSYYDSVKDITWEEVRTSLNILDFFNGLQRRLPSIDKTFLWFKEDRMNLTDFGSKIGQVGNDISTFVQAILGMGENTSGKDGENAASNMSLLDENVRTAVNAAIDILRGFAEIQQTIGTDYAGLRLQDLFYDIGTKLFLSDHLGALFGDNNSKFNNLVKFGQKAKRSQGDIDGVVTFLTSFADIQSKLNVSGGYIRLGDFVEFLTGEDGLIKYMGENGSLQTFINEASKIDVSDTQGLVDLLSSWAALESTLGETYVGGYLPSLTEDMIAVLHGIGFDIVKGLTDGMEGDDVTGETGLMSTAMATVKTAAFDAGSTPTYMDSLKPIGSYLIDGLVAGITENAYKVSDAVSSLSMDYVVTIAKKDLEVESPSKVFYGIGMFIDQGLANGISDYADIVAVSTEGVSEDALTRAKTILADISSGLTDDISSTPTITPVLDMSNVSSGMSSIDSLFGNRTIGINTDRVSGLFGSSSKSETAVYDDARVVSAIHDINERLNNLNNNIMAMQVVLDTGVLAGAMAPRIDRYLGRQARRN